LKDLQEIAPVLDNAGQPLEDVATAGQSDEEHLKRLAEAGYKTVFYLRTPEERRSDTSEGTESEGRDLGSVDINGALSV
jgi:hypothetical protein